LAEMPFLPGDGTRLNKNFLRAVIAALKQADAYGPEGVAGAADEGGDPSPAFGMVRPVQVRVNAPNAFGLYDATWRWCSDYDFDWKDLWGPQDPLAATPATEYQCWAVDLSYTSLSALVRGTAWFQHPVPLSGGELAVVGGDFGAIPPPVPAYKPGSVGGARKGTPYVGVRVGVALGREVYAVSIPPRQPALVQLTGTTLTDGYLFAGRVVYQTGPAAYAPVLDEDGEALPSVWLSFAASGDVGVVSPGAGGVPGPAAGEVYAALPQTVRAADGLEVWAASAGAGTPAFSGALLTLSANVPLSTAGLFTVPFDLATFDAGGYSGVTANSLVVPRDGVYAVGCHVELGTNVTANAGNLAVQLSVTRVAAAFDDRLTGNCYLPGGFTGGLPASVTIDRVECLAAGDTVQVRAQQDFGLTLDVPFSSAKLWAYLLTSPCPGAATGSGTGTGTGTGTGSGGDGTVTVAACGGTPLSTNRYLTVSGCTTNPALNGTFALTYDPTATAWVSTSLCGGTQEWQLRSVTGPAWNLSLAATGAGGNAVNFVPAIDCATFTGSGTFTGPLSTGANLCGPDGTVTFNWSLSP
jgi:hypothetical protein